MLRSLGLALALGLTACQSEAPPDASAPPAAASSAAGARGGEPGGTVAVTDPFVSAAPAGGTGGVFLTLTGGAQPDTLVGVRSDVAERAEVHETYAVDGLRGMREVGSLAVPAGATVALAPGGYHVMLLGLTEALATGDTVDVELEFARAGTVPVRVPVQGLDAMPRAR